MGLESKGRVPVDDWRNYLRSELNDMLYLIISSTGGSILSINRIEERLQRNYSIGAFKRLLEDKGTRLHSLSRVSILLCNPRV